MHNHAYRQVPASRFSSEYVRIAAANFTVLLGGFGATTPLTVSQQVQAADGAGLTVIPSSCYGECLNISGRALWGFQIKDEPSVADFPEVAAQVAIAKAAGQLAFVNLLPNYGILVVFW